MHVLPRGLFGVALMTLVACGGDASDEPPEKQPQVSIRGGLDRATFFYNCAGPADPQCNVDADLAPIRDRSPFPQIAAGSRFKISAGSQNYPAVKVAAVSPDFLTVEGDGQTYLASRAGAAAVIAQQSDGTPVDFANLDVVRPTKFKILQATPQGDFRGVNVDLGGGRVSGSANVKYTFKFRVVAVAEDDSILAGALPCQWVSSRPDVARLTSDPASNIAVLESVAAGTSEVTVTMGDFTGVVNVEVGQ